MQTINITRETRVNRSDQRGWLWVCLALLILGLSGEYLLYRHSLLKHVVPYFPVAFDQLGTYEYVYLFHYDIVQRGLSALGPDYFVGSDGMKGLLLPLLGVIASLIWGPSRETVAACNFVLFAAGQVFLIAYGYRRGGFVTALLAIGFFLLSDFHFGRCGGIFDLRRECAGVLVSGLTFMAVTSWLESGKKSKFWIMLAALLLSGTGRFITLFYWVAAAPVSMTLSLIFRPDRSRAADIVRRHAMFFVAAAFAFLTHIGVFWHEFDRYYISLKRTDQDSMRWIEYGVHDLAERLGYYPGTFLQGHDLVIIAAFISVVLACIFRERTLKYVEAIAPSISTLLFLGLAFGSYAVLTMYSPNPLVVGFLAMPFAIWLSTEISNFMRSRCAPYKAVIVSALVALAGAANLVYQLQAAPNRPHTDRESAAAVNLILDKVTTFVNRETVAPPTVYWAVVHEGIYDVVFNIYWHEHARKPLPKMQHLQVQAYPAPVWADIERDIDKSDLVVACTKIADVPKGQFEYPAVTALRQMIPQITSHLAQKGFHEVGSYYLGGDGWKIGVFQK